MKNFTFLFLSIAFLFSLNSFAFDLFIELESGRIFTIVVDGSDSIQQVKADIETAENIPVTEQRLFFASRQLEDGRTLADYNIQSNSTVQLKVFGPSAFITTWRTTTANESITIPTTGTGYNYSVDWGDGTTTTANTGDATHNYATAGDYTVSIIGDFPRIHINNTGDKDKIISIEQWGTQQWTSMNQSFRGCSNLNSTATDSPNLLLVSSMNSMFSGASLFNGDVSNWNVSNVTSMIATFNQARAFNGDVSNWNVSNVTNMSSIFENAVVFNGDVSNWNVSNVTNMRAVFNSARAFNRNISLWDVRNVERMDFMFAGADLFNGDLSSWMVDNVTNMASMFSGASLFNGDVSNWNVSNVTNMSAMFYAAQAFNSDVSMWDVGNVTNMNSLFDTAVLFNGNVSNWDVSNVTNMRAVFNSARVFNRDISLWDVRNVERMDFMFAGADLFNGDLSSWMVNNVTDMDYMFSSADLFNGDLSNWNVSNVTSMREMFTSARAFDQNLSNWDVSNVVDMNSMFNNVTLSTTNYDALLNGWSSRIVQPGVAFSGGNSQYCAGETGRNVLANATNNWTITDGGSAAGDITDLADQNEIGSFAFPTILGTNLSSSEMYYTAIDGGGLAFAEADTVQFSDFATYPITIYIYDAVNADCSDQEDFELTISDPAAAFITTWRTTTANESITIPTTGTGYNYTVDWGDGTTITANTSDATHTYTRAGDYTVSITGEFPRIYFNDFRNTNPNADKIISINQWGTQVWTSMFNAFTGCSNLQGNATDIPNLSSVTNATAMFYFASSFNQDIGNWDVSNISNMTSMFVQATQFNQNLNMWDVSNVTVFKSMFSEARAFNGDVSNWQLTSAVDISFMFAKNPSFNQNISGWDTSNVRDMRFMFNSTTAFDQNLGDWDISNVTDMSSMFDNIALSTTNYDNLLIGWNRLDNGETRIPSNISLGGGTSKYCAGTSARMNLINNSSWTITDGGSTAGDITDLANQTASNQYTFPPISGTNLSGDERYYTAVDGGGTAYAAGDTAPFSDFATYPVTLYMYDAINADCSDQEDFELTIIGDTVAPAITAVNVPSPMTYLEGDTLNFVVDFDETIVVDETGGSPQLTLTVGTTTIPTLFQGVSNTGDLLAFTYIVQNGDLDLDGIEINTLDLNGATIRDNAGNNANLTLNNVSDTSNIFIDALDTDGDGTLDSSDNCPNDANKIDPGSCGCGIQDIDSDSDGTADCNDQCPTDALKTSPGSCGCGIQDIDSDRDGVLDCNDQCPFDPFKTTPGINGCGNPEPLATDFFITTWRTTAANESITIPTFTGETYSYYVDWGDGTTTNANTGDATHTYTTAGDYTVSIVGAFPRIFFNNNGDRNKIQTIEQWGSQEWTSMESAFRGCFILNITNPAIDVPNLSITQSLASMFSGATSFNGAIGNWDVSNVTNMNSMFFSAGAFNQPINDWEVSNVTDMSLMFSGARAFNQRIGSWNVSNVTTMAKAFEDADGFNQDIGDWDVGNVTRMGNMFNGADAFNQNLNLWNTTQLTNTEEMFRGADSFNGNITAWNMINVEKMNAMFNGAAMFNQNIGNWNVSSVTEMEEMFEDAVSFDQDLGNWDISNVDTMNRMFRDITLSTQNYDATLIGWNTLDTANGETQIPQNINFDGGDSKYCQGEPARTNLMNMLGWTITDGGIESTSVQPDIIPLPDVNVECDVDLSDLVIPTASNCSSTFNGTTMQSFPITMQGTTVVTWTYDDGNGNTSTQTQNVVIDDTTAPVADMMTLADVTAECQVTMLTAPTATDNCEGTIIGTTTQTFPIATQGTTVVTWTYDDGNGNTTTQTQNVIIDDITAPVADMMTLADVTAECEVTALVPPTATDNCNGMVTVTNDATLPINVQGTTVVTWTYDDGNGNTSTQTQNVVIDDMTAPVADMTTLADVTAECEVTALVPPTATDNCNGMVTVTNDATLPINVQGTTVVTWTYDDGNGNTSTQTQNVVIDDMTAPVADMTTLADVTAECEVTMLTTPTATDNCNGMVTVTNDANLPINAQGTTVVTWTYDDGNGNTSTQTQNVIIDDMTAPVADMTTLVDVTAECEVTMLTAPTATDNCNGMVTVTNDATLPINAQGTTVVTWTYDDGNGNTSTQTQNVVINDMTAPTPDVTLLADVTAECEVTMLTAPTATDNCNGMVTVTNDATLPINAQGTTVVTWTYDDGNGNTSTQTQNVVINDMTAPVADMTTLADVTAECEVTMLTAPTATDNCNGLVTVTNDATLPINVQGTTVVTWTYDDGNGNTSTQTQNVIVNDVTAPVADVATLTNVTAECEVTSLVAPTATDNCNGMVTVSNDANLPINAQGTTVVTWTYDDGNGNTSTQTQNVIIDDMTAPVADMMTLADVTAECEVTSLVAPTATDNCNGMVTVTNDATLPINVQGTTVVTWTYDDGNGNTSTQTQNVIIDDMTAPVADMMTLADVTAECEVTMLTAPTATDNCNGLVTVTNDATLPINAQGTTVVTWTYDDGNGNTSTQTQNVVLNDVTAPVADVATLASISFNCEVNSLTAPTATDNCIGNVIATTNTTFPITASTMVTWSYDDGNGNISSQSQQITINYRVIDQITDATVCDSFMLPAITGTNLTGTAMFYTMSGGNGTAFAEADIINFTDFTSYPVTLYAYDIDADGCSDEISFQLIINESPQIAPIADVNTCDQYILPLLSAGDYFTQAGGNGFLVPQGATITNSQTLFVYAQDVSGNCNDEESFTVTITSSDIANATFTNQTFTYDGTVKSLVVANVPASATIVYTNNDQVNAGTYTVTATISSANATCNTVTLSATLSIDRAQQSISFNSLAPRNLNVDPDFQLTASSSSGLPIDYDFTFTGANPAASVSSTGFVTLQNEGEILITARQAGDNNYLPAQAVSQPLEVFARDNAILDAIIINGEQINNPTSEIFYLLDCSGLMNSVDIELQNNNGATFDPAAFFIVDTPRPGIYTQEIIVTAEDGTTVSTYNLTIERRFAFDDIVEQKYNNTLVVNNNAATNGGYEFVAYQWFKNNRLVSTEQFFSEGDNSSDTLDPLASYYVKMTTVDGDVLQTCISTISLGNTFSLTILENPVIQGGLLKVRADFPKTELDNAQYQLYSATGQLIRSVPVQGINSQYGDFILDLDSGLYRLVLVTSQRTVMVNFIKN